MSEAKAFIDYYSLKKKKTSNFSLYYNDLISLTICGIGKINAAMSIVQTFYEFKQQKNNIWINFGVAGHKKEKIGSIFLVDKVIDNETKKKRYPFILDNCKINQNSCITYNEPNFNYTNNLSDMEASGFFFGCEKYSSKEFIHSIKIISDNEKKKINFFNKDEVKNMVLNKIEDIDTFIKKLYSTWTNYFEKKKKIENIIRNILIDYRLTFSEEKEFRRWLSMYFYHTSNEKINFLDNKKDIQTNIQNIKKKLGV
jgi:hypothetical protein